MSKSLDEYHAECPRCGEIVEYLDHDCDAELLFDDGCPMCGEAFDSYTTHIQTCDGA
jgi:transcription initiation factor IIE alpha subunit